MHLTRCLASIALLVSISACQTVPKEPGIEVRTVEVVRTEQRPCPGEKPERPAPLERPLPTSAEALIAVLGAKLAEWSAPGQYGDKADTLLSRCLAEG